MNTLSGKDAGLGNDELGLFSAQILCQFGGRACSVTVIFLFVIQFLHFIDMDSSVLV